MKTFLSIVVNKFFSIVLTVLLASIPFFIVIFADLHYGFGHSPVRQDEAFIFLGAVMILSTFIIEIGRLFPSSVSGVFNVISFVPALFFSPFLAFAPREYVFFFQAMCAFGVSFYPLAYIGVRKILNKGFWAIIAPTITFGGLLVIGVLFALSRNEFVVYKLPFILLLAGAIAVGVLVFKAGFEVLSTAYYAVISKLPTIWGYGNDKGSGAKEKPKKEQTCTRVRSALWKEMHGTFVRDINVGRNYNNSDLFEVKLIISRHENSYGGASSFDRSLDFALRDARDLLDKMDVEGNVSWEFI